MASSIGDLGFGHTLHSRRGDILHSRRDDTLHSRRGDTLRSRRGLRTDSYVAWYVKSLYVTTPPSHPRSLRPCSQFNQPITDGSNHYTMSIRMIGTSLALVSVLLIAFLTTDFRFGRTSVDTYPSFGGRGEVSSNELEYDTGGDRNSDVVEFLDWDVLMDANPRSSTGLQNGNTGDSTSESTYCNTWCMLKQSLGLTIVGLLLICIRLVFAAFLIFYFQSANSCHSPSLSARVSCGRTKEDT